MTATINSVCAALAEIRLTRANMTEAEVEAVAAGMLVKAGLPVRRQRSLDRQNRVDLFVGTDPGIVVEVKLGRPSRWAIEHQCGRYLNFPIVAGAVILVERTVDVRRIISGKPVRVVSTNAAWGIAP